MNIVGILAAVFLLPAGTFAQTEAVRCEVAFYRAAAKYSSCIYRARARVASGREEVSSRGATALDRCYLNYEKVYGRLLYKGGQSNTDCVRDWVWAPRRFLDNGDGTVTDELLGLMWEKKSNDGTVHDYTLYQTADQLLSVLNDEAGGGSNCFAGHCDWRIPSVGELASLLRQPNSCIYSEDTGESCIHEPFDVDCSPGCTVLDCSCPSGANTTSGTSEIGSRLDGSPLVGIGERVKFDPDRRWSVSFNSGDINYDLGTTSRYRAVRRVR